MVDEVYTPRGRHEHFPAGARGPNAARLASALVEAADAEAGFGRGSFYVVVRYGGRQNRASRREFAVLPIRAADARLRTCRRRSWYWVPGLVVIVARAVVGKRMDDTNMPGGGGVLVVVSVLW